jgi:hypothetical protein
MGNTGGAKLHVVRHPKDIPLYQVNGVNWVAVSTGGASTNEVIDPAWSRVWRLPLGTYYDASALSPVNDHDTHWNWEPARDMPLADYVFALTVLNSCFMRV